MHISFPKNMPKFHLESTFWNWRKRKSSKKINSVLLSSSHSVLSLFLFLIFMRSISQAVQSIYKNSKSRWWSWHIFLRKLVFMGKLCVFKRTQPKRNPTYRHDQHWRDHDIHQVETEVSRKDHFHIQPNIGPWKHRKNLNSCKTWTVN